MAEYDYRCTNCGTSIDRNLLTVKRIAFLEMGEGARTLRSRVVGWLCPVCVANDTDWRKERKQIIQSTDERRYQLDRRHVTRREADENNG